MLFLDCQNVTLSKCEYPGFENPMLEQFPVEGNSSIDNIDRCKYFCDIVYKNLCTHFVYDNIAKSCSLYDLSPSGLKDELLNGCDVISGDAGENIPGIFECFTFFPNLTDSCSVNLHFEYNHLHCLKLHYCFYIWNTIILS